MSANSWEQLNPRTGWVFEIGLTEKRIHPQAMTPLSDVIDVLRNAAGLGGQMYGNLGYLYAYNVLE